MENTFGLIVQRERNRQGLSLAKLSSLLNNEIDPSYINRLEKEKKNPSFKVVCLLTSALNLDVREVFRSFGFDNLITNYDEDAVMLMEELFRLHELRHPFSDRIINKEEQEILLNIIHAVFELSQLDVELSQLSPLLKEIQKLKDINKGADIIKIPFMDTTFYVDMKQVLARNSSMNKDEVKDKIREVIARKSTKLLDIQEGSFVINLDGEKWIAEIRGDRVTFLTRMDEVIDL